MMTNTTTHHTVQPDGAAARTSSSAEIAWMPATEMATAVRERRLSPVEIAHAINERVMALDPTIRALVVHDPDQVVVQARRLERAVVDGDDLGPLHGVPYTIKDLQDVAGLPTTYGLPAMAGNVAQTSDAATRRLERAGGLFIGKTNTPEMGWRGICDNHLFGPTRNPWDIDRTPGGSSGGAAAAVAAGLGPLADGSDGAGSIRIPASFCGVVGYKPSFGRVPFHFPTPQSIVHRGPLARTVADVALMASVMSGPDLSDPTSTTGALSAEIGDDTITPCRVGWTADLDGLFDVTPAVRAGFDSALGTFEDDLGGRLVESSPDWDDPTDLMWTMWCSLYGSISDLVPPDVDPCDIDAEFVEVMRTGASITTAELGRAGIARDLMWQQTVEWFEHHDVMVLPTLPCTAFEVGREHPPALDGRSLRDRTLGWLMTYPFNLVPACPVISVPCGFDADGLPIGLSIVGRPWADAEVLRVARAFERARPWAQIRPALTEHR